MNLSETLVKLRISAKKSQAEFAKLAGVSQRTWSSYESGQSTPKMGILWALAAKGYPIKGLTTNLIDDMAEEGKIDKDDFQKRLEIAKSFPPDMPIDDFTKALRMVEQQNGLITELEKVIYKAINTSKTILNHESRLAALEERLQAAPELAAAEPEAEYPPEAGGGEGSTAEPEPEYGEEETARIVAFHEDVAAGPPVGQSEDVAAGPPVGQSEDGGWEVAVPRRFIKTRPEDYYVLQVRGNSMIDALIPDGSVALIRWSDMPRDRAIQVVRIDGRVTLKRMREGEDHSWTLHYEDGTGRTIPLGEDNRVQGDFVAVLPPSTQPRMRGE